MSIDHVTNGSGLLAICKESIWQVSTHFVGKARVSNESIR